MRDIDCPSFSRIALFLTGVVSCSSHTSSNTWNASAGSASASDGPSSAGESASDGVSASQGDASEDTSGPSSDSQPTTDPGEDDGQTTADPGEGTQTTADPSEGDTQPSSDSDEVKFDMLDGADSMGDSGSGTCDCGNSGFSYIWIANSVESTVSKINTRTLTEEGRYITRPDKAGDPSRTSVTIDGKAVAVANRNTGIVKIWARPELCKGGNTSTGRLDVKAWGTDDCVAWYTPFSDKTVQRPVQWTSGTLNPATC